jgi:Fe-S-cluster-containing dehydrogenase component/CRP-like cAMP-binding protein
VSGNGQKIERPQRWSVPFADEYEGAEMDEDLAAEVVREHLAQLVPDQSKFPSNLPLESIIRNDTRLRKFKKGEIVVRRGDYGSSAFLIVGGGVNLLLKHLPDDQLGRRAPRKEGVLRSIGRVFSKGTKQPEVRELGVRGGVEGHVSHRIDLQDFPEYMAAEQGADGKPVYDPAAIDTQRGELFGELAALGRIPRSTTAIAADDGAVLLEIRWQALRDIRRFSPAWKEMLDDRYRRFSLRVHLREARYTSRLERASDDGEGEATFEAVSRLTQFHSYGDFEWQSDFRELASADSAARLAGEAVIASQGNQPNGLIMVRSGFVRVRRRYNYGEKTVSYMGKGKSYGLAEIYHNWKKRMLGGHGRDEILTFQHTLSAVGYADTLFIPAPVVERYLIPLLTAEDQRELEDEIAGWPNRPSGVEAKAGAATLENLPSSSLEFLVEQRAINGSAAMLIDLDRCTRCDDCVQACATVHDNNPRFIRHGPQSAGVQLTHACMHCADPVCMIGCPTGAIHRDQVGDQVVINDQTCIGCSTCADNCPYHNIQMVEIRDPSGDFVPGTRWDPETMGVAWQNPVDPPIRKATKCDLCESLPTGPACANACPHDALTRIDLRQPAPIEAWLNRR